MKWILILSVANMVGGIDPGIYGSHSEVETFDSKEAMVEYLEKNVYVKGNFLSNKGLIMAIKGTEIEVKPVYTETKRTVVDKELKGIKVKE